MAIQLPTGAEIVKKGQLLKGYFPRLDSDEDMESYCEEEVVLINALYTKQLGDIYRNASGSDAEILRNSVMWMTLAVLWQVIAATMIGFAGSELPREYIDPAEAANLRDEYRRRAQETFNLYDVTPEGNLGYALPVFGVSDDADTGVGGKSDLWDILERQTGARL